MRKEELSKLRTLNALPSMKKALKKAGEKIGSDGKPIYKYRYHIAARVQQLEGILKVSVCTREDIESGIMAPKWDIFINYEGDEYTTRERQEDGSYKWRKAMCWNLENYDYYRKDYDEYCYINPEGTRSIKEILDTERGGWSGLWNWQQGCKKRIEDKKVEQLTKKWDEKMKPVKEPPKGFETWAKKEAFNGSHYIFYKAAGAKEGYCTGHLGTAILDGKQKHNRNGKCPVCKKKIVFVSRAIKRNNIWQSGESVSCIQTYPGGIVERTWSIKRVDAKEKNGGNKSRYFFDESKRILILKDETVVYVHGDYRRRGVRWHEDKNQKIKRYEGQIYPRNIKAVLKNVRTAYQIAVENGYKASGFAYYMYKERKNPEIEMCYKAGLPALGYDIACDYWKREELPVKIDNTKQTLAKKLGIDDSRLKRMKKLNGDLDCLEWLQQEKIDNTLIRDEDIRTIMQMHIGPKNYKSSRAAKYMTLAKICNYIRKQAQMRQMTEERVWDDWNDYISMLEKMKMDCSREILLKPKDLLIAHNEMVATVSMKNAEGEIKKIEKKYREVVELLQSDALDKYRYEDEKYCIVTPRSISDIYREGTILKHCIHTCEIYFNRINVRETYLVFLRKKADPEKPWYTLEIEPGGNIRQKKSVLNESYKDLNEAMQFLQKWQQVVKERLTEEDRKLAKESDKARREGYQKLREQRKIVWHGSFKGKLLADAMESDFMGVGV